MQLQQVEVGSTKFVSPGQVVALTALSEKPRDGFQGSIAENCKLCHSNNDHAYSYSLDVR